VHGERPILLGQITVEVSLLIAMASHASQQFAGIVGDGISPAAILTFLSNWFSISSLTVSPNSLCRHVRQVGINNQKEAILSCTIHSIFLL
jgi:hypothetical protein